MKLVICIFTIQDFLHKMNCSSKPPSLGAICVQTGAYVSPANASKSHTYMCPECSKDLTYCKGSVRISYFRHKVSTNPCNYYTSPSESQIHKDAKMRVKQILDDCKTSGRSLTFTRICSQCRQNEEYLIDADLLVPRSVVLEYSFTYHNQRKQADVAVIDDHEDNSPISIEIYNSHKTREEDRPDPWFEIDATQLIHLTNDATFSYCIPCMRNTVCDACLDANNKNILEKCKQMEELMKIPTSAVGSLPTNKVDLEHYIRYKLGQREFNECRFEIKDGEYKSDHVRFDYDANDDYISNDAIMDLFSQFMGKLRVITYSHEGTLWYEIIDREDYDVYNDKMLRCEEAMYEWMPNNQNGTVDIIMDALEIIDQTIF